MLSYTFRIHALLLALFCATTSCGERSDQNMVDIKAVSIDASMKGTGIVGTTRDVSAQDLKKSALELEAAKKKLSEHIRNSPLNDSHELAEISRALEQNQQREGALFSQAATNPNSSTEQIARLGAERKLLTEKIVKLTAEISNDFERSWALRRNTRLEDQRAEADQRVRQIDAETARIKAALQSEMLIIRNSSEYKDILTERQLLIQQRESAIRSFIFRTDPKMRALINRIERLEKLLQTTKSPQATATNSQRGSGK